MAEGLWRELGRGEWEAFSAGSKPSGYVHPLAVEAMKQRGFDISMLESKSVEQYTDHPFDLVVTVCDNAKEDCPVLPGATQMLHWPFEDPADAQGSDPEKLAVFVHVRDQIENTIKDFLRSSDE